MDPQIKRRLKFDIIVYPCTGKVDGDPVFGDPITLKGYETTKVGTTITRGGQTYNVTSVIYMDGENASNVHVDDEVVSVLVGRLPIKLIAPYPGLGSDYEVMVVYL